MSQSAGAQELPSHGGVPLSLDGSFFIDKGLFVVVGLVPVILAKLLDIRYVGFKNSTQIKLPLYDYIDVGKKEEEMFEPSWLATNQVKFLSHNVWCHYLQQWYAPSAKRRLDCLLNAIAQNAYDVVMVQELFLLRVGPFAITRNLEYFVARMRMMGYTLGADPRSSLPFCGQNSGLCTFSRVDVVGKTDSQTFLKTAERICVKGFVRTDVKLSNDRILTIVNTHMDSKSKKMRLTTSQAFQIKEQVLDRLYRSEESKDPAVVIAGDFNVCSRKTQDHGEGYADLQKIFMPLIDIYGPSLSGGESKATRRATRKLLGWRKVKAASAIDHAFVSGVDLVDAKVVDLRCQDGTVVSDHLGLEFVLQLV